MELLLKTSQGTIPVTKKALQIIYDSLTAVDPDTLGVKLLISTCLNGVDHEETQKIGKYLKEGIIKGEF